MTLIDEYKLPVATNMTANEAVTMGEMTGEEYEWDFRHHIGALLRLMGGKVDPYISENDPWLIAESSNEFRVTVSSFHSLNLDRIRTAEAIGFMVIHMPAIKRVNDRFGIRVPRHTPTAKGFDLALRQATSFAFGLLFPESQFRKCWREFDGAHNLGKMAEHFQCGSATVLQRAAMLGLY